MYIKKDKYNNIKDIVERNIIEYGYDVKDFFNEDEPYLDMLEEVVEYIKDYITLNNHGGVITIMGDYDVDGICATANMYWGLYAYIKSVNAKITLKTRLPRRFSEGYGLSEKIIDEIDEGLIITVDNGISSYNAIKKAKEKGLYVIVTDHHICPTDEKGNYILPPADVILNPHINPQNSDFEDYCGAGIAYRIIKRLLPDMELKEFLSLTSIATVADVMPLYGANRVIVRDGLRMTNSKKVLPGMRELMFKLDMLNGYANEGDYGFKIGPVFNASGRLYDNGAEKVLRLLKMDNDDPKLVFKADSLIKANDKRKEITKMVMEKVEESYNGERPIVIYNSEIGEGIIGLVSGRMAEKYNCPCITFTDSETEGIIKGSGRSPKGIHLKETLDKCKEFIVGYGGHAGAVGLSIKLEELEAFKKAFSEAVGEIPEVNKDVYFDMELDLDYIEDLCNEQNRFSPYGEGNPRILFHLEIDVDTSKYQRIGDGTHFMIKDERITILGFGLSDEYENMGKPNHIDCVGYLSESWWNDEKTYKFELVSLNKN